MGMIVGVICDWCKSRREPTFSSYKQKRKSKWDKEQEFAPDDRLYLSRQKEELHWFPSHEEILADDIELWWKGLSYYYCCRIDYFIWRHDLPYRLSLTIWRINWMIDMDHTSLIGKCLQTMFGNINQLIAAWQSHKVEDHHCFYSIVAQIVNNMLKWLKLTTRLWCHLSLRKTTASGDAPSGIITTSLRVLLSTRDVWHCRLSL